MRRELRQARHVRQRNRELEAEIETLEQHYRAQIQAYSDTCRMIGISRPPDKMVAYWGEAQRLMNMAIEAVYNLRAPSAPLTLTSLDDDADDGLPSTATSHGTEQTAVHRLTQRLSAGELRAVRTRFAQRADQHRAALELANADLATLRNEVSVMRQRLGPREFAEATTQTEAKLRPPSAKPKPKPAPPPVAAPTAPPPAAPPPPTEPMMTVREHRQALDDLVREMDDLRASRERRGRDRSQPP